MSKPRIAIIPGDPSGIGPEIIAKLFNEHNILDNADILLIGDSHIWQQGADVANVSIKLATINQADIEQQAGLSHFETQTIDENEVQVATVTVAGGQTSLRCLDIALDLAMDAKVDGILFAPFNKAAMTSAGLNAEDEHKYIARYIGFDGHHSEINVLDDLMTTRVTSHIGIKDVAKNITQEEILKAVKLADQALRKSGNKNPRIAVAALNPHAGDNGKFGREEIDIIKPAIAMLNNQDLNVTGPWPADTVFLKAKKGEVDAVVTMYHDQGQIAIKLMGFERGVTIAGGMPIAIATPAHGTAFDIAGKGIANVSATKQAFELLVRMATTNKLDRLNIERSNYEN
ncbi:MAG: 4-hydroxythreonine-4-phosphate dehydrogenase PdxA [Rhizobiales bacterium]|nr:4-hydroxythreonine-4-phosphate dehydrogenase PdxA [Hyphomicrobiales bacterium]